MAVSWRIESDLVWLVSEGTWDPAPWQAAVEAFLAHPDYRPGMGLVHDRRNLQLPAHGPAGPEVDTALRFARSKSLQIGSARWALVVTGPLNYGLGRMAQMMSAERTGPEIGVFYDLVEAEAWVREGQDAIGKSHTPEDATKPKG